MDGSFRHVRAVVLDWAGTMVDHGSLAPMGVFVEAFARFGVEITIEEARGPMGMAKRPHIAALMAQPRIGYTHWQSPERNILPSLSTVDVPDKGVLGVAVEGDARRWPYPLHGATLPVLDPVAAPTREVTLFNGGRQKIGFTARTKTPWLKVSPASGEIADAQPLSIEVDWDALPELHDFVGALEQEFETLRKL